MYHIFPFMESWVPLPTLIWRHQKERIAKCSLRGLEGRQDIIFFSYPNQSLPDLTAHILLTPNALPLNANDANSGLLLLDGTWRYVEKMAQRIPATIKQRSLPKQIITAYPRRQNKAQGLASIEALFSAYTILGRPTEGLLDSYHWADRFLSLNEFLS